MSSRTRSCAPPAPDALCTTGRGIMADYRNSMLLNAEEWGRLSENQHVITPSMDIVLKSQPSKYV